MSAPSPPDILLRIAARRRERYGVAPGEHIVPASPGPGGRAQGNALCAALAAQRGRAVIAEVKMGSPKLGSLVGSFDPVEQARTYARSGAAALSVVVEPDFFHGSYDLLYQCRRASGLPAIAKDFVVSSRQLAEAREAGASAVLLIAALYEAPTLRAYAGEARRLGLVPLIETHDTADLAKLEGSLWELVGVNNRDLHTFRVDLDHSIDLLDRLPTEALKVAESGIHSSEDVERLRDAGFDAFLIGESLITAQDPAAKLVELVGVPS